MIAGPGAEVVLSGALAAPASSLGAAALNLPKNALGLALLLPLQLLHWQSLPAAAWLLLAPLGRDQPGFSGLLAALGVWLVVQ